LGIDERLATTELPEKQLCIIFYAVKQINTDSWRTIFRWEGAMKKSLPILLFLLFFFASTVTSSTAGFRHHGTGYGYHYSRHFNYHRPYYRGHSYYSNHLWAHLGIGLLTGAVIGSVLYQPPRQRTIVYHSPPPVIVYSDPVVLDRQRTIPPPQMPQLVLRRVKTTPEVLNIRSGPGLNASVYGQIRQNAILDVLGAAPEWLYIRTETGQYGWVMARYTREIDGPVG
jgi:uncharacterized protein YgiM (DUF1202 family)